MARILILNQPWFSGELRERGHDVLSVGYQNCGCDVNVAAPVECIHEILDRVRPGWHPEVLFIADDSRVLWCPGVERLDAVKVFLSVDTHHHAPWHTEYAEGMDVTLVAHYEWQRAFKEKGIEPHWFPLWAERVEAQAGERTIDVCFRGTFSRDLNLSREAFFKRFQSLLPCDARQGEFRSAYTRAKVVVNHAVSNDLNFRVFEAMSCGALLVTPKNEEGLHRLFVDGEDLVTYEPDNAEDAAQKCRYYLQHPALREEVAASGLEKVRAFHTARRRAETLEALFLARPSRTRKAAAGMVYSYLISHLTHAKRSPDFAALMLDEARRILEEGLGQGDIDERYWELSCRVQRLLTKGGKSSSSFALYDRAKSVGGVLPLRVTFAGIEAALHSGQSDRAAEIARGANLDPAVILTEVSRLLDQSETSP